MGQVIEFPIRADAKPDEEIDLLLAIDVAIRDLRDIEPQCSTLVGKLQAVNCRMMLERAFDAARREP